MNPLLIIALLGGGFLLYKSLSTVDALSTLQVQVVRFQVYRIDTTKGITFRIIVKFANLANVNINIDRIYMTAYLDTSNKSNRVCTLDAGGFTIPANSTTEQEFFVEVTWLDALIGATSIASALTTGHKVNDIRLVGIVKALGSTIEFDNIIPISTSNN